MSLASGISGIFESIYGLFASLLATVWAILHGAVSAVQSFIVGIVSMVQNVIAEAVHVTGGVTKFIMSNFVVLAIGGVLVFAYLRYTTSGRQVAAGKKTQ